MIENILNKLSSQEVTELLDFYGCACGSQRYMKTNEISQQIEYASKLLKTNTKEITAKRLMFVWDISRATAYRRIKTAQSHN